jgi:biopolymer transport protein ExbB
MMKMAVCISACLWVTALGALPGRAQDPLDLGAILEDDQLPVDEGVDQMDPGDNKTFHVTTDDDITSLETGDIYKNNQSSFKVVSIRSKGSEGGRFTVERIGGKNDPIRTWSRTSGLGPSSIISRETLWDLYLQGGVLMHFILACAVITIILGLNCAWVFRVGRHCPPRFIEPARACLQRSDIPGFQQLAQREKGLFGHICRAMAVRFDTSTLADVTSRAELEGARQVRRLRLPLEGLSLIAAVAPLLGLLGTVIGIVISFEAVAFDAASAAKAQALALGIRMALFTTLGGLCVAIPALFIRFFGNTRLSAVVSECELCTEEFLHEVAQIKRNGEGPATPSETTEKEVAAAGAAI